MLLAEVRPTNQVCDQFGQQLKVPGKRAAVKGGLVTRVPGIQAPADILDRFGKRTRVTAARSQGAALGSKPGGALAATRRIRDKRSGAMIPLTGPPAQLNLALGFFDQPTTTLIPGPSAPVEQSTTCA